MNNQIEADSLIDTEYRLENWARVVRDTIKQGVSMTGIACDRMRMNSLKPNLPGFYDEDRFLNKQDEPDVNDAWLVNRAWQILNLKHREMLKQVYVLKKHPNIACKVLSIRHREFDMYHRKAVQSISIILSGYLAKD